MPSSPSSKMVQASQVGAKMVQASQVGAIDNDEDEDDAIITHHQ